MRVRGLKLSILGAFSSARMSHPVRVRGLKFGFKDTHAFSFWSHPVRVRGLKFPSCEEAIPYNSVAPRAGAWIEIKLR